MLLTFGYKIIHYLPYWYTSIILNCQHYKYNVCSWNQMKLLNRKIKAHIRNKFLWTITYPLCIILDLLLFLIYKHLISKILYGCTLYLVLLMHVVHSSYKYLTLFVLFAKCFSCKQHPCVSLFLIRIRKWFRK